MDRELTTDVKLKRLLRRLAIGLPLLLGAWGVFFLLPGWLRPSVSRSRILTARVERGPVEETIEASGTVLPAREKVLSSPIDTRILKVLEHPGDAVHRGDALLELDTETVRLELDRIEDRLARKHNEQLQLRLALERSLAELKGQIEKAELDRQIAAARHERDLKMSADGLISKETLQESEVEEQKAGIGLEQLRASVESARRATATELDGVTLDLAMLEKERGEARHRLELATTRAEEDGVLTWIATEEGSSVRRGDVLARVARLDTFRVEARVSDVHAPRIAAGLSARVVIDERVLAGSVASVYPKIEEGTVKFTVELEDPGNSALRQNLRVDVLVVTGSHEKSLRVRRGPFAQAGGALRDVFVVRDGYAVRTRVRLGLAGREYVEVEDGLAEGDELVTSDMSDYAHMNRIGLR